MVIIMMCSPLNDFSWKIITPALLKHYIYIKREVQFDEIMV